MKPKPKYQDVSVDLETYADALPDRRFIIQHGKLVPIPEPDLADTALPADDENEVG